MRFVALLAVAALGFGLGKADDHIRPTMWGWAWQLTPEPDFLGMEQLVECPGGVKTFPPWHVRVLYSDDAPIWRVFWQERGR